MGEPFCVTPNIVVIKIVVAVIRMIGNWKSLLIKGSFMAELEGLVDMLMIRCRL